MVLLMIKKVLQVGTVSFYKLMQF